MSDRRILVVEDDSIIGIDIVMRCKMLGFDETRLVFTGENALEEMELFDPQIYVLDILLSGSMSGIDVAESILQKNGGAVIFLTGNPVIVEQSGIETRLPFCRILSKPVSVPSLKKAVDEADAFLRGEHSEV